MAKVDRAAARVERLTRALEDARVDLRKAVREAHEAGESQQQLAARLHLSRTRVQQLLRD